METRRHNAYKCKLGQVTNDKCSCGQTDTVDHFLLQCPLYKQESDLMELKLSRSIGLYPLDLLLLLDNEDDDNIHNFRKTIREELMQFIRATGRFKASLRAPQIP